ncbi:MAG: hypothetical protein JW748_07550, partial [Anaerolineales bacterium]|nr:hypothetical protein [Anaerolineales bacterium]
MESKFASLSASVNHHFRGIHRVGALSIGRRQLFFLIPFLAVGAGFLSTESANNPNPNLRIPNRNNEAGLQSHAVAVPRYIPHNRANYQGTEPDLTVAKANDTGGNATVGVLFNWTLTVTNGGTIDATFTNTQTILRDPLPAGPAYGAPAAGDFVNITNSENITCSINEGVLTCTAVGADVTIGGGGSFTVTLSATPSAPGVLDNTATVDPDSAIVESDEGNNTGSDSVTVSSPAPDLTVAKSNDTSGNAEVGVSFNWTLTVANGGTIDATFTNTQTILRDPLPAGPAYGAPAAGDFILITNDGYIGCSIISDVLTCTADGADVTIGAGGSFTVTFSATPAAPGVLDNTATVDPDSAIAESDEGNNTGSDSVTAILTGPDLTVAKTNNTGGNATVGVPFYWTLTVANSGTLDATFTDTQTILRDPLPAGPAYGAPAAGDFILITNDGYIGCSIISDVLTCTADGADVTIGAGGSFTVTFTATPAAPGVLDNTATVDPDSAIAESDEGNNTGSDSVTAASPVPDLTVVKSNDTSGNATVGILFNWTLTAANGGLIDATFADTQTILQDSLPAGPAYGAPAAGDFVNITNSG